MILIKIVRQQRKEQMAGIRFRFMLCIYVTRTASDILLLLNPVNKSHRSYFHMPRPYLRASRHREV